MKKVDIIMFSMSHYTDWQKGRVNRNYHILNQLQQDERVGKIVSVDFLPFNWRKVAKIYWENVIWPMKDLEIIYGDLTSACHRVNDQLYIYSTIDSIYSQLTVVKELRRIIKALDLQNIVFWSYNPLFTMALEEVSDRYVPRQAYVFDVVDNWLEHPAFAKYQVDLKVAYQVVKQDADLIFTVSDHLRTKLFDQRQNCFTIMNGIDNQHFAVSDDNYKIPAELADLKHPIVGYHGVIEDRVNLELVRELAQRNPDKSFVLIGAGIWKKDIPKIEAAFRGQPNVRLISFVPYQKIPQYIKAFDVAIVPHKINEFTRSMNPLKFYEYCAAGKPLVTTPLEGIETFGNLLYLANNVDEFDRQIKRALSEDNPKLQQARREAVADDSWFGRTELMMKYLFDFLEKKN